MHEANTMPRDELYGGPTKRFFISMLTRDIELEDAILDLLDNSVDGAMRQRKKKILEPDLYSGYWAHLTLDENSFRLADNCGGIPDDRLETAFRLGRPRISQDMDLPTIGMYGIGMKRAIFKMGHEATVETSSEDGVRKITYSREWMDDAKPDADQFWDLAISRSEVGGTQGVMISIPNLREEVRKQFSSKSFKDGLIRKIGRHFAYLILRGLEVKVNETKIQPKALRLYTSRKKKNSLNPFDYVIHNNDVTIRVTVGFHWRLPQPEELEDEENAPRRREDSGISVVCNDRVILSNDTTFRTAWGTRGVPKFHNQFLAIGGLMSFMSNNADALPVSTTKTGVEMESEVYDHALTLCAEGLKIFTSFTNKWKGRVSDTAPIFDEAILQESYLDIRLAQSDGHRVARDAGLRFRPVLPLPKREDNMKRISFMRPGDHIDLVSDYLFDESRTASAVGEACFDRFVEAALEE